jgi:prevent-host-death family protein
VDDALASTVLVEVTAAGDAIRTLDRLPYTPYRMYAWVMAVAAREPGPWEIPVTDARTQMAEVVEHAGTGEIIYLTRHGRRVAAVVSVDDAEALERAEDAYLSRLAAQAEAEGGQPIPMADLIAELGLA